MTFTVIYSSKAETEILNTYNYYEECVAGLGDRFVNCIGHKVEGITRNPLAYPIRRGDLHECWAKEFPFLIVYQILEKNSLIVIASVFHTSRNPKKKYRI